MTFKPFRPPSFKKIETSETSESVEPRYEATSLNKRRRLSPDNEAQQSPPATKSSQTTTVRIASPKHERRPLKPVTNPPIPTKSSEAEDAGKRYFSIVWRKVTAKKNKTWEDDGVLTYKNGLITAFDSNGRRLGSLAREKCLEPEDMLIISGKDIEVEAEISYDEFSRIVCKDKAGNKGESVVTWQGHPPPITTNLKVAPKMSLQEQMRQQIQKRKPAMPKPALIPAARNAAFRNPLKDPQVLPQVASELPIPRHDPFEPDALVFKRLEKVPPTKHVVDVVLDPLLTKKLRDHQREGVQFLYECVMGIRKFNGNGCILADDMGLGKTLQTIALVWTLLKQNPIYRESPVVKKVLVVCPVTLVQNWKKEFRKWLGRDRVGIMCFGDEGSRLSMFDGKNFNVMIVGYERLTKIAEDLNQGAPIDLIVCDEGHRLKTLQNRSAKAIETLNTTRRIILSGTPIQNDLTEFFAMVNFVNEGVLGTPKAFLRDFEKPILKSRQPNATEEDIERGREASEELAQTTSQFILRRTADILSGHLPLKTEYVLFCKPTRHQAKVYQEVLQTPMFKSAMGGSNSESALQMITILKKLCNSPGLLKPKHGAAEPTTSNSLQTLNEMLPNGLSRYFHNIYASKLRLLDELLQQIKNNTYDKVVLVSNYTSTLDLMQNVVANSNMKFLRLDGSVGARKRLAMVEEFNKSSQTACAAFLLSAKAGGVGVNLIGANRLILFDIDWNPAVEAQAMARIHREGQKKPCHIYRFLIKGGIEERIWQRQVVKRGLADSIMDSGPKSSVCGNKGKGQAAFSAEELRDLFTLDENDGLRTHDLIGCSCKGKPPVGSPETGANKPIDDIDEIEPASDEGEQPVRSTLFTPASQVSEQGIEDQESSIKRVTSVRNSPKKRKKQEEEELQELMTYTHVDTAEASILDGTGLEQLEGVIDDECLVHVLTKNREELPCNIAYVFLKKSRSSDLEIDTVPAHEETTAT